MLNIFDIDVVFKDVKSLLLFVPITLYISVISGIIGLVLGFLLAVVRIKKIPVLNQIVGVFISFKRGTPIIVQLYITYFGIPIAFMYINYYKGTNLQVANVPPIVYALFALALNTGAFCSIIIQSAFEAINQGEIEAAAALGMTGRQRMFRIIIPEALDLALPNLGNQFIGLIKGTSLAFTCSVVEMTAQAKIIGARGYRYFEAYVALAIIYWIMIIVIEQLIKLILHLVKVPDIVGDIEDKKLYKKQKKLLKKQGGLL